ncbi:MAG TPA: FAD-binding protein [Candidatus Avipropionibacterium avicola]|uniref:FAD-binding protein n=1 Tax=Candidatus Avipropionibacterium avicola TaxID=2840701 RepID=A0A9D1H0V5_9ACTN|nr:FAD-binding protein [Candidatus Avipropionibacterium avicola]
MVADSTITVDGHEIPVVTANTVVVGTGAAGYCAAARLVQFGTEDVVVVTDKIRAGASRNAGSDKQTYYKLTLSGHEPDSVRDMAETLFAGGSMDGDIALAEAAWSPRTFFNLVEAGVPFPHARSGEFIGYKTDHDPRQRATSVGPYTSRTMVEQLEKQVRRNGTRIIDACRVVDLVVESQGPLDELGRREDDGLGDREGERASRVVGLLCLRTDVRADDERSRFLLLRCTNIIYATGGPAGMYADAVYPHGQWGANGAALRAGVHGKNLTEWQFGLASIKPRWNVSGTYMQVVPRFISTDQDGNDEREFLTEAIADYGRQMSLIFLKGYQWPFDIRKALDGSSLIDLLVYRETVLRGRRVFLDFRSNPVQADFDPDQLSPEAYEYLDRAGVLGLGNSTPIERLQHMNRPAYNFYLERNPQIDLEVEPLEVAVCAQHNNGGLTVDQWWHSNVEGFFPVGEAAGAHGIYRPGGAALNSGQVGATRAASYVAARRTEPPVGADTFARLAEGVTTAALDLLREANQRAVEGDDNTDGLLREATELMSRNAAVVRSRASIDEALAQVKQWLDDYGRLLVADARSRRSVNRLFLIRDIITSQYVYLCAMADYLDHGGRSRGSVLYTDPDGTLPQAGAGEDPTVELDLPEIFRFQLDGGALADVIQETVWDGENAPEFVWRGVRPIPSDDEFFENVWRGYREDRNIH